MNQKQTLPRIGHGHWWLPDDEENWIAGKITIDEERITLELSGTFQPLLSNSRVSQYPIIFGKTTESSLFTLVKCSISNSGGSITTGISYSKYRPIYAIRGAHYEEPENTTFNILRAHAKLYDAWLDSSPFSAKETETNFSVSIETKPEPIRVPLKELEFRINPIVHFYRDHFQINLKKTAALEIESESGAPLRFFQKKLKEYTNFFVFASGTEYKNYPVFLYYKDSHSEESNTTREIELIYPPFSAATETPDPMLMPLPYDGLNGLLPKILNSWDEICERLEPALDSYFATRYHRPIYLEVHFLNIARALEVLHRRTSSTRFLEKETFKSVRESMLSALPATLSEEEVKAIKGKLSFLNEISLRERLHEILQALDGSFTQLIPSERDFIAAVTNTRNYLTHYNPDLAKKAVLGMDLYWILRLCQVIFELRLMQSLGFSPAFLSTLVRSYDKYTLLRQQLMNTRFAPTGWSDSA